MEGVLVYIQNSYLSSICFKLFLALVLGGLIGIDRERQTRSAGFRTNSLVCLGATIIMIVGEFSFNKFGGDVTRLGAQVVSGIGFLGAGAIMYSGTQKVRGLTTAAALWTCASIGLAIGIGFYSLALLGCLFTIVLLKTLKIVDEKNREKEHFVDIYLELYKASSINDVINYFKENRILIVSLESVSPKVITNELGVKMVIKVSKPKSSTQIIGEITKIENVSFIHKMFI